jgi:hypothetical protein
MFFAAFTSVVIPIKCLYVGNTGELDQEAGETMLREYPEVMKAVFLHVVTDNV